MDEKEVPTSYTLSPVELELMASGSQPITDNLRTWGYSVTVQVKMRVALFSNPVDTVNNDHLGGDHDIDHALAQVAQEQLNKLTGKDWRTEIIVDRIVDREVID